MKPFVGFRHMNDLNDDQRRWQSRDLVAALLPTRLNGPEGRSSYGSRRSTE